MLGWESVASEASYSAGCTYVRFHRHLRPVCSASCSMPIYFDARLGEWDFALGSCQRRHPHCRRYYVATETIRTGSRRTPAVFFFRRVKEMERKEIGLVFSLIGSAYPGAGTQNWTNKIKPICKRLKLNSISCWTIETPRHFGRVGNWIVYATNHLMMSKVATFYHLSFQRRRSCKAVPLKYDTVRCKWMIAINFPADSMAAK